MLVSEVHHYGNYIVQVKYGPPSARVCDMWTIFSERSLVADWEVHNHILYLLSHPPPRAPALATCVSTWWGEAGVFLIARLPDQAVSGAGGTRRRGRHEGGRTARAACCPEYGRSRVLPGAAAAKLDVEFARPGAGAPNGNSDNRRRTEAGSRPRPGVAPAALGRTPRREASENQSTEGD